MPDLLDLNGDAQNSLVLAQRARWAGWEVEVEAVHLGNTPERGIPQLVVVGSGSESGMPAVLEGLHRLEGALRSWVDAGTPLLAVGTGWELLAESVEFEGGRVLTGLGLFSGRSVPAPRVSDDLVVNSRFGRIVGYENHERHYLPTPGAAALGSVLYGIGNGDGTPRRIEGELVAACIGTHLHGPILAKNPALADHLLGLATEGRYEPSNATAIRVDNIARAARNAVAVQLGLDPE